MNNDIQDQLNENKQKITSDLGSNIGDKFLYPWALLETENSKAAHVSKRPTHGYEKNGAPYAYAYAGAKITMASPSIQSPNRPWYVLFKNRRFVQASTLVLSNAYFLSFLRFIPCGYLQCSNCSLSTFTCPLILVQKGAVMLSMGMFGMMSAKIIGSIAVGVAILLFFGSALGAWACGWLCPFGFLQDMLGKIPLKKFHLPSWSGYFRIPIFIGLVGIVPYLSHRLFFCDVCPSGTINRLWQQAAGIPLFFKAPEGVLANLSFAFLIFVLMLSIFTIRPFCGLFCPIGGITGLFNKISGLFLCVDEEKCVSCNLCQKSCPQGIDPSQTPAHSQCVRCLECTGKCKSLSLDLRL